MPQYPNHTYEHAAKIRKNQRNGCKGIDFGGKPHILDAMEMVSAIWNAEDGRYITQEGIKRCWRKSNILPAIWNIDINNEVGRSMEEKIRKEECDQLCNMMKMLKFRTTEEKINTMHTAPVLDGSFVNDGNFTEDEWIDMVDTWIDVEEDPMVMDSIIDDEMMKFDSSDSTAGVTEDTDDDDSAGENGALVHDDEDDDTNIISHIDVTNAFDTIRNYIKKNDLPPEILLNMDRLQRKLQQARALSTKLSPSILAFFKKEKKD